MAAFAVFLFALIACLWSPARYSEQLIIAEKYSKMLYLPVLVAGFCLEARRCKALQVFLLAMLIVAGISILKFHGFLANWRINPDNLFRNHIMTGFMTSFAAYLCLIFYSRSKGKASILYLVLTGIYSYQLFFINAGRMSYIIYFLLVILFIAQVCSWKQALAGLLVVCSVFVICYTQSDIMRERVNSLAVEFNSYHQNNKDTSLGFRLQFHSFAQGLFLQHPLLGSGTGGYVYNFRMMNPVPVWGNRSFEPHSQYWLIAVETGLAGLIILSLFFYYLLRAILQLDAMRSVGLGMLIPFLLGNFSDSLLFYSGSGYFFLLFIAVALGEQLQIEKEVKEPDARLITEQFVPAPESVLSYN